MADITLSGNATIAADAAQGTVIGTVRHAKETGALPTTKADRALEEAIETIRKGKT